MSSFFSDDQLSRKDSPTQPRQYEPTEIYYKLSCSETLQFEVGSELEVKQLLKEWIEETLNENSTTTLRLSRFVNNEEVSFEETNTAEIAFKLSQLTIELYKIKSTQFSLTSDEICRINEIEKEIKEIINL